MLRKRPPKFFGVVRRARCVGTFRRGVSATRRENRDHCGCRRRLGADSREGFGGTAIGCVDARGDYEKSCGALNSCDCCDPGGRIIVNDRADVALTEGAGGVHLGEAGLPVADVVRWVKRAESGAALRERAAESSQFPISASDDFLIGVSCHSLEGAKNAVRDGADYIFFGPVFATPSKAKFGEPQGVAKLAAVCGAVDVPVIAIGGITLENAGECIAAGAAGVAAIRLFQDAADPAQIVSTLKKLRR